MGVMVTVLETGCCSFTQTIYFCSLVCLDEFRIFLHRSKFSKYHTSFLPPPWPPCLWSLPRRWWQLCVAYIAWKRFLRMWNPVVNSVQSPVSEILPHPEASAIAIGNSTLAEMPAWFLFSLRFMKTKIEPLPLGRAGSGVGGGRDC